MRNVDCSGLLPHRPPFLLIDEVLECTDTFVRAVRRFRPDESFFAGHFPGRPIVPGVLLIEAMAQALACLALARIPAAEVYLTGVERVRFRQRVLPGDLVELTVQHEEDHFEMVRARAQARVRGHRAAEAILLARLALVPEARLRP
jgi:3-hydroxymyristoyl/3-hydroxydecanoyl-(acyl carrier protein) dehydratase